MSVIAFHEPPPDDLARALETFERQFTYPLGPGRSFRIEHGRDYARFYRSQGDARCFVRLENDRILGVLCIALRPLSVQGETRQVAYIGDLKVTPEARDGFTLHRLARAALSWAAPHVNSGYGVVMDGTPSVPSLYTGRVGIPSFEVAGRLMLFRLQCGPQGEQAATTIPEPDARCCFDTLTSSRLACSPGQPASRSLLDPLWLKLPDDSACGCLEDTRRAKRLIDDRGEEMVSAHLSCFAFRDPPSGVRLLRAALHHAHTLNYPALFVAVDAADAPAFVPLLSDIPTVQAPATVYAHRLPAGAWLIPTSEI